MSSPKGLGTDPWWGRYLHIFFVMLSMSLIPLLLLLMLVDDVVEIKRRRQAKRDLVINRLGEE